MRRIAGPMIDAPAPAPRRSRPPRLPRVAASHARAPRPRPGCSLSSWWPATGWGCTRSRASMTRSRALLRRSGTGRTRSSACSRTSKRRPSSGCSSRASSRSCWARRRARRRGLDLAALRGRVVRGGRRRHDGFVLGRKLGRGFLFQHGPRFHITPAIVARVEGIFDKHGSKAIISAASSASPERSRRSSPAAHSSRTGGSWPSTSSAPVPGQRRSWLSAI